MKTLLAFNLVLGLVVTQAAETAHPSSSIIATGAKLEKLSGEFKFTEGPTCDNDGNVFFTDQPNNRIMKWGVDGKLSEFLKPAGRANARASKQLKDDHLIKYKYKVWLRPSPSSSMISVFTGFQAPNSKSCETTRVPFLSWCSRIGRNLSFDVGSR